MKILFTLGFFIFALSFCNLVNRFTSRQTVEPNQPKTSSSPSSSDSPQSSAADLVAEKAELTAEQAALLSNGKDIKWDEQGIEWRVPASWKKMSSAPKMLMWSSSDGAFLIVNISPMDENFPADISLKANYEGTVTRKKNGEIETLRYAEIDGVKGVEFTESAMNGKDDPRRHQWIAFRKYAGQLQMLNVMLSTKGGNFEKHRDEFAAILYSMKLVK